MKTSRQAKTDLFFCLLLISFTRWIFQHEEKWTVEEADDGDTNQHLLETKLLHQSSTEGWTHGKSQISPRPFGQHVAPNRQDPAEVIFESPMASRMIVPLLRRGFLEVGAWLGLME